MYNLDANDRIAMDNETGQPKIVRERLLLEPGFIEQLVWHLTVCELL